MTIPRPFAAALACLILLPTTALAQPAGGEPEPPIEIDGGGSWSLADLRLRSASAYWDNDGTYANIVNDQDRYYTNGFGLELSFDPNFTDEIEQRLAPAEKWGPDPRFGVGLALKQQIYTGIDITDPSPALDDHPYGGYLYFALSLQRARVNEDWSGKHDHFELDLGVVGERSQGEAIQRFIHNLFPDNDTPQGWDHQLANEVTINLTFERTWRTRKGDLFGLEFDMLPAAGFDVGNVFIRARGRATMRLGMALPDDFGPATFLGHRDHTASGFADPDSDWSVYGYITIGADAVAHNIFLAGNTFATSRSVDLEPLVASLTVGLLARYRCVEFGWAQSWQTTEFETQPNGQTWGSWVVNLVVEF